MRHSASASRVMFVGVLALLWSAGICGADEVANLLLNPGAEKGKGEAPSVWFAAHVPADGLRMWRSTDAPHAGEACLAISNQHQYEQTVCNNWAQQVQQVPVGKAIRLSACIRTENADAVNACVQCWDLSGEKMLAFASTPVFRGDQDWILVRSQAITVPAGTATITVRAVLTGLGKAWFDDVSLSVIPSPVETPTGPVEGPDRAVADSARPQEGGTTSAARDLAQLVSGRIVRSVPVSKDCMVLKYLPLWEHGNVDNIAVANNDGGVRTLLDWPTVPPEEARRRDRRFLIALYSRKTTSKEPVGPLGAYEVLADWLELTSWKTVPRAAEKPAATFRLVPREGWKLFDITPLVRAQADPKAKRFGAMLRFIAEDRSGEKADWSGYAFVSREGIGQWADLRPRLVVVEPPSQTPPSGQ